MPLGATELIVILVIILVLFGAGKLPALGAGLGEGIKNFKRGLKGEDNEEHRLPSETDRSRSDRT